LPLFSASLIAQANATVAVLPDFSSSGASGAKTLRHELTNILCSIPDGTRVLVIPWNTAPTVLHDGTIDAQSRSTILLNLERIPMRGKSDLGLALELAHSRAGSIPTKLIVISDFEIDTATASPYKDIHLDRVLAMQPTTFEIFLRPINRTTSLKIDKPGVTILGAKTDYVALFAPPHTQPAPPTIAIPWWRRLPVTLLLLGFGVFLAIAAAIYFRREIGATKLKEQQKLAAGEVLGADELLPASQAAKAEDTEEEECLVRYRISDDNRARHSFSEGEVVTVGTTPDCDVYLESAFTTVKLTIEDHRLSLENAGEGMAAVGQLKLEPGRKLTLHEGAIAQLRVASDQTFWLEPTAEKEPICAA
jgi:hypothetical protein